jgi:AraC-like DNA-binding protein
VLCTWLRERVGEVTAPARHANAMSELLMSDASVRTPEQAAARLAVSVRTLQRMAHRVGLSPAAIIRRRRLQEAAERITDPDTDLATRGGRARLRRPGLANDFRAVLGITASSYRAAPIPGDPDPRRAGRDHGGADQDGERRERRREDDSRWRPRPGRAMRRAVVPTPEAPHGSRPRR